MAVLFYNLPSNGWSKLKRYTPRGAGRSKHCFLSAVRVPPPSPPLPLVFGYLWTWKANHIWVHLYVTSHIFAAFKLSFLCLSFTIFTMTYLNNDFLLLLYFVCWAAETGRAMFFSKFVFLGHIFFFFAGLFLSSSYSRCVYIGALVTSPFLWDSVHLLFLSPLCSLNFVIFNLLSENSFFCQSSSSPTPSWDFYI